MKANDNSATKSSTSKSHLLKTQEITTQTLHFEIQKGIDSGIASDFDVKTFLANMHIEKGIEKG